MKTSTTAIIASVAVLVAIGAFYNGSSLNPKTSDSVPLAFASGTTASVSPTHGFFTFDSGKTAIAKNKFIGMGLVGTAAETEAVSPFDGVLSTLAVHVNNAPGSGKTWTFTVYVDGSATDLECDISGSAKTCVDEHGTADITIGQADTVNVKVSDASKRIKKTTASATVAFEP